MKLCTGTTPGTTGPRTGGDLSADFVECKVGVNQSPIDIVDTIEAELPPIVLDYTTRTTEIINNGHTAQVNVEPGSFVRVETEEFELLQIHLHAPSEHRINGEQANRAAGGRPWHSRARPANSMTLAMSCPADALSDGRSCFCSKEP